jgi:hypothetical protein
MSETALPVRPAAIPPRTSSLPPASTSAASSIHGVINTHPNSLWRDVTNAAWRRLLTRVGDSIMYHILMHAIVCIPLENECFAQISGPMVSTAVRTSNQSLNRFAIWFSLVKLFVFSCTDTVSPQAKRWKSQFVGSRIPFS